MGGGGGSLNIVGLLYVFYVRRRHSKCVERYYSKDTSVPKPFNFFSRKKRELTPLIHLSFERGKVWPRFCIHISRLTLFRVQVPSPCSFHRNLDGLGDEVIVSNKRLLFYSFYFPFFTERPNEIGPTQGHTLHTLHTLHKIAT